MVSNTEQLRPNNNFLPKYVKYTINYDDSEFRKCPHVIYPTNNYTTNNYTDYESKLQNKQTKRYK